MFILRSPLFWRWLGSGSSSISLRGRCCGKPFDQIVTMTGKQPGWIRFTPHDYFTACKSVSLSINMRMSSDYFLLVHQTGCTDGMSPNLLLLIPLLTVSPRMKSERRLTGWKTPQINNTRMNGINTVCRRDAYMVIWPSDDSASFTNHPFVWLKDWNQQITGEWFYNSRFDLKKQNNISCYKSHRVKTNKSEIPRSCIVPYFLPPSVDEKR